MDLSQRERLSELVEELTTSGQPHLDQQKMKEVKKICKYGAAYREHVCLEDELDALIKIAV